MQQRLEARRLKRQETEEMKQDRSGMLVSSPINRATISNQI